MQLLGLDRRGTEEGCDEGMGGEESACALPDSDDAVLICQCIATGLEDDLFEDGHRSSVWRAADGGDGDTGALRRIARTRVGLLRTVPLRRVNLIERSEIIAEAKRCPSCGPGSGRHSHWPSMLPSAAVAGHCGGAL